MKVNNEVIINNENESCEFEENSYLKYKENDSLNYIDFKNKLYKRENKEFIFQVDFKNKLVNYTLKGKDLEFSSKIDCSWEVNSNDINLKYKLDEDEKELLIHLL